MEVFLLISSALSLAFVILWSVTSVPATIPEYNPYGNVSYTEAYVNQFYWFNILPWISQSYVDLAMGFAALTALLFLISALSPRVPRSREISVRVPRFVKDAVLLSVAIGLTLIAISTIDGIIEGTQPWDVPPAFLFSDFLIDNFWKWPRHPVAPILEPFFGDPIAIGETIIAMFGLMSLGMLVYWLEEGISTALRKTITFFSAPVIVIYELATLLFVPYEMPIYISYFTSSYPLGVILTNWFVLVIATGLLVLGLLHRRLLAEPGPLTS